MTQDEKIKQLTDTIAMQQQELTKYKMQLRALYGLMIRGDLPIWLPTQSIKDNDLFFTMIDKITEFREKNGLHVEKLEYDSKH